MKSEPGINQESTILSLLTPEYRKRMVQGAFHEAVTNEILDDIVAAIQPRFARLTAKFWVRGGIFTTVEAEHRAKGWKPAPRVELGTFPDEASVTERH